MGRVRAPQSLVAEYPVAVSSCHMYTKYGGAPPILR